MPYSDIRLDWTEQYFVYLFRSQDNVMTQALHRHSKTQLSFVAHVWESAATKKKIRKKPVR